jgi:hypothetical protein
MLLTVKSNACDICGCGAGSNYLGILPEFSKRIIGVRYRYNHLQNHLSINNQTTYLTSREKYYITELWMGYNVTPSFRIMVSLPYQSIHKATISNSYNKGGLGDVTTQAYYQFINHKKTLGNNKTLAQSFWAGVGIKLPTGKYNVADKVDNSTNLFQLGTGSTDFTLQTMYDIRLQDVGLNFSALYKVNTTNKNNYQYGNKLNTTLQAYYKWRVFNTFTIAPNTGILYEYNDKDKDRNRTVYLTGGSLLNAMLGVELKYKKIVAGFNWQTPLQQNLAEQSVKAYNRSMLHIGVLF